MWTRKELKDKAKVSFRANYWKSVLVALIVMALSVGVSAFSPAANTPPSTTTPEVASSYDSGKVDVDIKDGKIKVDVEDEQGGTVHIDVDDDTGELAGLLHDIAENESPSHASVWVGPSIVLAGMLVMLIVLIASALAIAVYVFVFSPLEVGSARFFLRNLNQPAEVREVAFGYDNNYKEIVKTIFLRSLFVFLWSLLLIVPGIYKAYEYRMIPYLLAEDPTMTKDRAFSESKRMMDGQKWNAFVLDLSFLGWNILSALTLGILGVFYVDPYQTQTNAALYEKLRYGLPAPSATQPMPAEAYPMASAATAPVGNVNASATQVETAPVIASASQPPVVPFAAVGAEPASTSDATAKLDPAADSSEVGGVAADSENEASDSPEA